MCARDVLVLNVHLTDNSGYTAEGEFNIYFLHLKKSSHVCARVKVSTG